MAPAHEMKAAPRRVPKTGKLGLTGWVLLARGIRMLVLASGTPAATGHATAARAELTGGPPCVKPGEGWRQLAQRLVHDRLYRPQRDPRLEVNLAEQRAERPCGTAHPASGCFDGSRQSAKAGDFFNDLSDTHEQDRT